MKINTFLAVALSFAFLNHVDAQIPVSPNLTIYGRGLYPGDDSTFDDLRLSGFTTVVLSSFYIHENGDVYSGDSRNPIIHDGKYIGDKEWLRRIASLRQKPGSVTRLPYWKALTFKMNGMVLFAFYSGDGKLLAVTHNIVSTQLPIQLMMNLRRNYSDFWVSDLFECDADGNTSYFITIENADSKVTLRSNGGDWEAYTKATKI